MTTPLPTILDREKPARFVAEHFAPQLWLLRDLVNYGSNLIVRCFECSDKAAPDVIVLGAMVKQAVAMLDGVELLVSNAAILASQNTTRAFYEAHLYVLWALAADTERRARQYYVWSVRQRRLWASRIIPGTAEATGFQHALQHVPDFQSTDAEAQKRVAELQQIAQKEVQDVATLLNSAKYKAINEAFDNYWNKPYDPPWHAVTDRVPSVRQLADRLGLLHEYDVFYSELSKATHGTCFQQHIGVRDDTVTFEPLRHLQGITLVFNVAPSTALRLYRKILQVYRPGEVEAFRRKYMSEWREAHLKIKEVECRTIPSKHPKSTS